MLKRSIGVIFSLAIFLSISKLTYAQTTTYYFSPIYEKESGVITKYYPLPGGAMATRKNGTLSYLHQDHLASTRLITDNLGQKTQEFDYYPYGSPRLTGSTQLTGLTDRLYTSQILDFSTDLYFYNARQYNPTTGAFISADFTDQANRYAYVNSNPINKNDPTGTQGVSVGVSIPRPNNDITTTTNSPTLGSNIGLNSAGIPEGSTWPLNSESREEYLQKGIDLAISAGFTVGTAVDVWNWALFTATYYYYNYFYTPTPEVAEKIAQGSTGDLGNYTLKLIQKWSEAFNVNTELKDLSDRKASGMHVGPHHVLIDPNKADRGTVAHEILGHETQFMSIAQGIDRVFRTMYADNPWYFEAKANAVAYNYLVSHGGTPKSIQHQYNLWVENYNLWQAHGSVIPRFDNYATSLELLRVKIRNLIR